MITFNMIDVHIIVLQPSMVNGVIEPQQDGHLHWHIMLYSSVLSPDLLEKATAASSMALQSQIGKMLDGITCTTVPSSEVESKVILMGHPISCCHGQVVRSFFIHCKMIISS
jgi:hypothetical protein